MRGCDVHEAVGAAYECFAELVRTFDEGMESATRLGDLDMVEHLSAAKIAAKRGCKILSELQMQLNFNETSLSVH